MDVRLAGITDGVDAAHAVSAVSGTKLIFVTANADPATVSRIRRVGDYRIVPKPVMPNELLEAMREVVGIDGATRPCAASVWQISALPRRSPRAPRPLRRPQPPGLQTAGSPAARTIIDENMRVRAASQALCAELRKKLVALDAARRAAAATQHASATARAARAASR
jgi:CheY-like chemotaxis protein